ncbi:DNA-dependent protein kinase catalytic subunit, partial [Thraustotheca clavata]
MSDEQLRDVGRALSKLHEIVQAHAVEVGKEMIESCVSSLFRRTVACVTSSRTVAELCLGTLFQSKRNASLLDLLHVSNSLDMTNTGQVIFYILDYLLTFMRKFHLDVQHAIGPHLSAIAAACRSLLTAVIASKTRCAAADLIRYVVKHFPTSVSPLDLQLHGVVQGLYTELNSSKCTQTAKGSYLELLSTLFMTYPSDMNQHCGILRAWIESTLEKQFSGTSPEMTLISGCFLCLNQILQLDSELANDKRDKLFSYISRTLATTVAGSIHRLTFVKSCLTLLRYHASKFQSNFASDSFDFYVMLRYCCLHSNKTIRKPGFEVLPVVLQVIVSEFKQESNSETIHKKQFQRFLKEFLFLLNDTEGLDKPSIALTGLAAFSPLLTTFMEASAAKKIYARLLKYGEDVLALHDTYGSKWLLLCQYTLCFAACRAQSEDENVDVEDFAVELGLRVLDMYPTSALYTRYRAEMALIQLFKAFPNILERVMRHAMLLVVSNQVNVTERTLMYHPETGAPDTRFLFVYETLWKNILKINPSPTIFDAIMAELLSILQKLDLRYHTKLSDESEDSEELLEYQPYNLRDHTILLNLTEFLERWLVSPNQSHFTSWTTLYLTWIFNQVKTAPLVSPLYRLGRLCGLVLKPNVLPLATQQSYCNFISDLTLALEHYRDELLLSACLCILAAPLAWTELEILIPALKQVIALGVNHSPTAEIALNTLETWNQEAHEKLSNYFAELLPLLAPYLDTTASGSQFQTRLLRWLGALGGHSRYVLQENDTTASQQLKPLEFNFSLFSSYLTISLASLLQPLQSLVQNSADRTIKAAAAEALHALVIYLCGKTATLPQSKSQSNERTMYFDHWNSFFPTILQLATDSDSVVRTLFHTLLFQLVRWFSGVALLFPYETQAFVDSIVAVLAKGEGGVRDNAAKALAQFLKFGSKQNEESLISAQALFDQIFTLCSHPNLAYRLGAALIVEHMYRDFREDNMLVQVYALDLLKNLLMALKLQDNSLKDDHVTTLRLVRAADHLEKIITRCHSSLKGLQGFVERLVLQVASPQRVFRHKCQSLFLVLSRVVNQTGSCRVWLTQYFRDQPVQSFVDDIVLPEELLPTASLTKIELWYDTITASTETVAWLVAPTLNNQSLIAATHFIQPSKKRALGMDINDDSSNRLWTAIKYFFSSVQMESPAWFRAFNGVCRLVIVILKYAKELPELAAQWTASALRDQLIKILILSKVGTQSIGMQQLVDEQVWMELTTIFLKDITSSIAFRSILDKQFLRNPQFTVGKLLQLEPGSAIGVCNLYSSLHRLRLWSGLEDEEINIAKELSSKESRTPLKDDVALRILEAGVELGYDLSGYLLQSSSANVNTLSLPRLTKLLNSTPSLWISLTTRTLVHVQSNAQFQPLIEHVIAHHKPTKNEAKELAPLLPPFAISCLTSSKPQLLGVLQLLMESLAGSEVSVDTVVSHVQRALNSSATTAQVKIQILRLIPSLNTLSHNSTAALSSFMDGMQFIVVNDFPLVSKDVTKGSIAYDTFENLLDALLFAITRSHTVKLILPLSSTLKEGSEHIFYDKVDKALEDFCELVPPDQVNSVALDAVKLLFDVFVEVKVRWRLFLKVTKPLMKRLQSPEAFFGEKMDNQTPLVTFLMTTLDSTNDFHQRIAFGLLECMYDTVSADDIRQKVNSVFSPSSVKGNELTMKLCKTASAKVATPNLAVAAYRCLLMTVRKTQTQEKFYTQLLFPDSMWNTIIDDSSNFTFTTETSWTIVRRREQKAPGNRRYNEVSTQFLEGSSLSQSPVSQPMEITSEAQALELELDEVNLHPCMRPLMETLVCMETLFQSQWTSMPPWMDKIRNQLMYHSSVNVKVFIIKLVLNRPALFAPYAAQWITPMMNAVVLAPHTDQFHYLLRDVCHLLLSPSPWMSTAKESLEDRSSFVNHLIRVSPYQSAWVLRDNLYLIESALESWPNYSIDMFVVLQMLERDGIDKFTTSHHTAGLHILAMVITLGFFSDKPKPSYQMCVRESQHSLHNALLQRITTTHKTTPQLACDVAGLLLKALPSTSFQASIENMINNFFQNDDKLDRFVFGLKQLSAHIPQFVDGAMLNKLQSVISRVWIQDNLSLWTMDLLLNATESLSSTELLLFIRPYLTRLIRHRLPEISMKLLDIVLKLWPTLPDEMRSSLILSDEDTSLLDLSPESDADRIKWLNFLMTSGFSHEPVVQRILLRALTDSNDAVRSSSAEYWAMQLPPSSATDRFIALCSNSFQATNEWVQYTPQLWLSNCAAENKNPLFDAPLSAQCSFEAMQIDTAWSARSQYSLTPMFSQDALLLQSQPLVQQQERMIKATQERAWSQTQSQQFVSSSDYLGTTPSAGESVKKRFAKYKSADDTSLTGTVKDKLFFQLHASRIKQFTTALKRQEASKGTTVPLYRAYRTGELPDIQIPRMDILKPLLAVAQLHAKTASLLLCSLVDGVLTSASQSFYDQVAEHLTNLLKSSPDKTVLVSTVQDILLMILRRKSVAINAQVVGQSSIASLNVEAGQLVLEEIALHSPNEQVWTQLQHVLQITQKETLQMAVSVAQTTHVPSAIAALQAQLSGDLVAAQKLYGEAEAKIQANEVQVSLNEQQRWITERLNCAAVLNKWDVLSTELMLAHDDIWDLSEPCLEQQTRILIMALGATHQCENLLTLMTSERRVYADRRFPELMGFVLVCNENPTEATALVEQYYGNALGQWTSLPMCYRQRQLQRLPLIVHLEDVLQVIKCNHDGLTSCMQKWQKIEPLVQRDSLSTWSAHYWSRSLIYGVFADLAGEWGGYPTLDQDITAIRIKDILTYAQAAVSSNVLALASRLLSEYRTLCTNAGLPKLSVQMVNVYVAQVSKLATRQLQSTLGTPDQTKGMETISKYYASMLRLFENDEVIEMLPTMPQHVQNELKGLHVEALTKASSFHQNYGDKSLGRQYAADALKIYQYSHLQGAMSSMHGQFLSFLDKWIEESNEATLIRPFIESVLYGMKLADETSA